jgi:geranylgeranyl diphosphate synthase type 3
MIAAWNDWLKVDKEKVAAVTEVVVMLHTSSLLIDDIEDDSTLRRGVPVSHAIYGLPSTLNTANYVYVLALEKCIRLNSSAATHVFTQELLNLHRGQGQDILWRDTCECPTEEMYRSMVLDKTGGLFRLAVGLLQAFSEDKTDYLPLLNTMAYYFQVRDDYMNIASTEYYANKSFCEDLTEGKFSFPIIHCIRTKSNDNRLLRILKQKTRDVTVKKHAVEWMIKCGSLEYTLSKLEELYNECIDIIVGLGGHDDLHRLLQTLHDQVNEAHSISSPSSVAARKKLDASAAATRAEGAEAGATKTATNKSLLSELNGDGCAPVPSKVLTSVGIRVEEVGSSMLGAYTTVQSDAVSPLRSTSGSFDTL